MTYDIIIIWAGAAGLFAWINLPKDLKKLILEKNKQPGVKVLLSGWERANVSNIDIEAERDYFSQNKKALLSVFKKYNQWDLQSFFAENWVNIVEEDRWRLILESWDSRELLDLLLKKVRENNCEIRGNCDVKKILPPPNPLLTKEREQKGEVFEIQTENKQKFLAKNVIVSTGWKSFFQVWTTWEWYNFAKDFWLKIISPTRALVWLVTKEDLKELSWVSLDLGIILKDKPSPQPSPLQGEGVEHKEIEIYREFWPFLFTHFWVSWPIIFNTSNAIWEYLNKIWVEEKNFEKYILENLKIKLIFNTKIPKRVEKFFGLNNLENKEIILNLQNYRSWKEAKATGWWIDLNELDKNFMVKKVPWLYFIWEVVDVVGKTWGFNLQWAFSSGFVCVKSFEKNIAK